MIRGTTPTLNFELPFYCSEIDNCEAYFVQNRRLIFTKTLSDMTSSEKTLSLKLSVADTLMLSPDYRLEMQLRVFTEDSTIASRIMTAPVEKLLGEL